MIALRRSSSLPFVPGVLARRAAASLCLALAAWAPSSGWALTLTVELHGLRGHKGEQGHLLGALYDAAGTWLKQVRATAKVAADGSHSLVFADLPEGSYALAVFQDLNANDKLDTNLVGIPAEPYGFSRDAQGSFGPPKFEDAVVTLTADTVLRIQLR